MDIFHWLNNKTLGFQWISSISSSFELEISAIYMVIFQPTVKCVWFNQAEAARSLETPFWSRELIVFNGVFHKFCGYPNMDIWMVYNGKSMKILLRMDELRVPLFQESPIIYHIFT
jgi:hypothetical protein